MSHLDDELVFSTAYLDQILTEEENKVRGLKKGASGIIYGLLAVILFQHPFTLDFIPKVGVVLNTLSIPENIYFVFLFTVMSIITGIQGTYLSLRYFNFRGLFLSLFIVLAIAGLSVRSYEFYNEHQAEIKKTEVSKIFTIQDRAKFQNKLNIK